jgi:hypothetical protein
MGLQGLGTSMIDFPDDNAARDGTVQVRAEAEPGWLRRYWLWFLVMAAMVVLVLSSHFVKAYSDPANWLKFAYHLESEFWTSRWPVGYPVYLLLASWLVGRFYVFWANLPILMGILFLAGKLAERLVMRAGEVRAAPWVGLMAMVWLFLFDFPHIVYLLNPYRDPLAIFFCYWAVYLLIGIEAGPNQPFRVLFPAGLLIGLAVCVKEPSVLMLLPMFGFGVVVWRAVDGLPFWRSVMWFGAGFVLGVAPFLIETYAHTHSVLLPPQSYEEGRLLPGMHAHVFGQISREALKYFRDYGGWSSVVALLLGGVWAVRRRNRVVLALVLPVAAVFFVFYSFYWTFSKRYFFMVLVFLAPVVACGTWQACLWLTDKLRLRAHRVRIMAVFTGYVTLHALVAALLGSSIWLGHNPGFTIGKAKALMAEIEAHVPEGGTLLAPRFLCEVVECFSPIESYPAYALMSADLPLEEGLGAMIGEVRTDGSWLLGEILTKGRSDMGADLVRGLFDLEPLVRISVEQHNMGAVTGDDEGEVILHRIRPWSARVVTRPIWTKAMPAAILRLDAGMLHVPGRPRSELSFYWDDQPVPIAWRNGANYVRLPGPIAEGAHVVRLESDAPLPERLGVELFPVDRPLALDFCWNRFPLHGAYLNAAQWHKLPGYEGDYAFSGTGALELPWLWDAEHTVLAYFVLNPAPTEMERPYRVACWSAGVERGVLEVPKGGRARLLVDLGGFETGLETIPIELRLSELGAVAAPGCLELEDVILMPMPKGQDWRTNPGEADGAWFLRSGWHQAERLSPKEPFRWTRGPGRMMVACPPGVTEPVIRICLTDRYRPEQAPRSGLSLTLDGVPLAFELDEATYRAGWAWLTAPMPPEIVKPGGGLYELGLDSVPWRPSEIAGSRDERALGVMVGDVWVISGVAVGQEARGD